MQKFFFLLLITIISAHQGSIGSCLKYTADGQACQQCIPNYHLYEGACYVNILGCKDYRFGNICHQCDKNYILVNNMCCDMVCMSKIFSRFKKQVKQAVIANNTQILNELIPFAQSKYLKDTSGRLVAIEVKEYLEVKRFFLLYEFYESQFYSKRLIVDYVLKSKKYIVVEWGLVSNSWNYGNVEWSEVQDDASILLLYPNFYPSEQQFVQIVVRKAQLSLVDQYEVATLTSTKLLIRTLYSHEGEQVVLKESQTVQSTDGSTPFIGSGVQNPHASTNTTNTNSTTSSATNSSVQTSNQTSQIPSSNFIAYELRYQGQDILAELDVNEPLIAAVEQVKENESWNHSLTLVVEAARIPDVIEFMIIGQNKESGSVLKLKVEYNKPSKEAFIVSISEELIEMTVTTTTVPSNSSSNSTVHQLVNGTVSLVENQVYIIEQGCTTHTYYISPLSPEVESIANTLKQIRQQALQNQTNSSNGSHPIIASPSLQLRRLVISENCQNSNYKEVAYVEGDLLSTREYFTYYFEVEQPQKKWYYLGYKNKSQPAPVFSNPYAYPIYVSDPSFVLYPAASLYFQTGISTLFNSKLSEDEQQLLSSLTPIPTSAKDRHLGKMNRFSIDAESQDNSKYRLTGWEIGEIPQGFDDEQEMVAILCPESMITETFMIGTHGPIKVSNTTIVNQTVAPTGQTVVTTTVTTSILGDETVTTNNVEVFLNEDNILTQILEWLKVQKPITQNYQLSTIQISEYNQALEYHLVMVEKNVNGTMDFVPTSEVRSVVVHDKISHENLLISFEVLQKPVPSTDPTQPVIDQVHPAIPEIPVEEYVVVDIKTPEDTSNTTTEPSSNTTDSQQNATNVHNETVVSPAAPSQTSKSEEAAPQTPESQESSEPSVPDEEKIDEKERVKQMLDSILQQLQINYQISSPILTQALEQLNQVEHTVKLTVLVQSNTTGDNYTVVAIGNTQTQTDPIIESVSLVQQQTIEKLLNLTKPVEDPVHHETCENKTINTSGEQVCLDESSSGQTDIIPNQETTPHNDSQTPTQNTTVPVSQPSQQVVHMIEQKSFEETVQAEGEVRKIYVNPSVESLSEDVLKIIELVKEQQSQLETLQGIREKPEMKVTGIQIAATTIYMHYAITVRITYRRVVFIRRYFFIVSTSSSNQTFMGHQDLQSTFDPALSENRAFTNLSSLSNSSETESVYQTVVNELNVKFGTRFVIQHIIHYRFRVFPLGSYIKVTLKNQTNVGNLHLISNNHPKSHQLFNWHQVPIEEIVNITPQHPPIVSNQTSHTNHTQPSPSSNSTHSTNSTLELVNQINSSTTNSDPSSSNTTVEANTTTPAPEQLIDQIESTTPDHVIIDLSLEQKLGEVLRYLSQVKAHELSGGSLEQYASTEDKSTNGTLVAVQFDLYFLKFVTDTLIREFICSVIRHQADGKIDIALFLSNDISLEEPSTSNPQTPTNPENSTTTDSTPTQTVEQIVKQEQTALNSDFVLVDPNELHYPEAISLIEQDPMKTDFDEIIDLNNLGASVEDIIKFLRGKYSIIRKAGGLRIVRSTKTSTVERFRVYFFREVGSNNYQIYRAVLDQNRETLASKYFVVSFELYAYNNQLSAKPTVSDQSLNEDTDIAYGYVTIDLASIGTDPNLQTILSHLNSKYRQIVAGKNVTKVQELKLLDGRINYKILFRDPVSLSEFKFIIFYQPQLQKVLVLNSVNLPHHSQYNQLTSEQQKTDTLFASAVSYLNSIHPEISGFTVKSVSKAIETSFSEYQIVVQAKNKKYKSLIRIASNNVDLTEINFSELVEISLDHYKLNQFEQMFIMNYQKLTEEELRTNSKFRMVLNFLHNSRKVDANSEFLGAAYKPYGLGFLYKSYFKIGISKQLVAAQVYIEAYSDKISLKSFKNVNFDQNLVALTLEQATLSKLIDLLKQKTVFSEFTIQSASAKDFLYGTLYKLTLANKNGSFDVYVYHDHSIEEIVPILTQQNQNQDQCEYEGSVCKSCKLSSFRVHDQKCIQTIKNCVTYQSGSAECSVCDADSEMTNGLCLQKANCGALCETVGL